MRNSRTRSSRARDMLRDGMIAALQGTSASPSYGAHLITLEKRESAALMWETVHRAQRQVEVAEIRPIRNG
jgi:hypothetical protein